MSPPVVAVLLLAVAYLVGAIPFGYLIGRARGVDLFAAGSGNIGATNAGRVLGRKVGAAGLHPRLSEGRSAGRGDRAARAIDRTGGRDGARPADVLRVVAALLAFLGHLFPIYLGFRGGKGVATGAGTIFVLVPGPAALAVLMWVVVLFASRIVSLASLAAVTILVLARLLGTPAAFAAEALPVTLYLLVGSGFVIVKHRANITRLLAGTENRIGDFPMRDTLVRGLHVLALGMWFGGAAFFNFVAAVSIFRSFEEVVHNNPSDRTAGETIISPDASEDRKKALGSALAGSAVGPIFPKYFAMQAVCSAIALVTALSWWNAEGGRNVHRVRVYLIAVAALTIAVGWPISNYVSELRLMRFSADAAVATAAKPEFVSWHLASLLLSTVTVCLSGIALALAARMPAGSVPNRSPEGATVSSQGWSAAQPLDR